VSTTENVTTQSRGILTIQGREYALYQEFLGPIKITDVKLLWLNTASTCLITLFAVLMAIDATRPESNPWLFFGGFVAAAASASLSIFMDKRAVLITPSIGVSGDGADGSSTLAVTSQSRRVSSTRLGVVQDATAHPEMADFLRNAFAEGNTRNFRQRPRLPSELMTPSARRQAWASNAGQFVALLALVSIAVAFVNR